jgi:hypothetical protein
MWLLAIAILGGALIGFSYTSPMKSDTNTTKGQAIVGDAPPSQPPSGVVIQQSAPVLAPKVEEHRYLPEIQERDPVLLDRWTVSLALVLFAVAAAGMVLYWLRSARNVVKDSLQYRDALRIWMPIVQRRHGTPRALKRFANRVRYLAMLQHDEIYDETGFDRLRSSLARLTSWFSKRSPASAPAPDSAKPVESIDESTLVVLASLREAFGDDWRAHTHSVPGGGEAPSAARANWPPDDRAMRIFERLLKGIRSTQMG